MIAVNLLCRNEALLLCLCRGAFWAALESARQSGFYMFALQSAPNQSQHPEGGAAEEAHSQSGGGAH